MGLFTTKQGTRRFGSYDSKDEAEATASSDSRVLKSRRWLRSSSKAVRAASATSDRMD
jgi:hypothetical protein